MFLLQIVKAEPPYEVVARVPGGGPLERQLIDHCVAIISKRRLGWFTSEAKVKQAISEGMAEAILDLKNDTRYVV